jgi:hypothetical protein
MEHKKLSIRRRRIKQPPSKPRPEPAGPASSHPTGVAPTSRPSTARTRTPRLPLAAEVPPPPWGRPPASAVGRGQTGRTFGGARMCPWRRWGSDARGAISRILILVNCFGLGLMPSFASLAESVCMPDVHQDDIGGVVGIIKHKVICNGALL